MHPFLRRRYHFLDRNDHAGTRIFEPRDGSTATASGHGRCVQELKRRDRRNEVLPEEAVLGFGSCTEQRVGTQWVFEEREHRNPRALPQPGENVVDVD
eukprot:CAMPEP_0206301244 /NCGR_PEP_ID=MMETSP0106_2-20121207/8113_1 /ASSEMBLY_ACC=CAM_ASM_000206 /TAXON_ID=81532 /ORGANISM="Acanthoeca-like sp., Strain 10tr" /LENGTH=97 /DNA_ID=CAMNT_0053731985 /DNA_START=255 /DNA_END=548 /DNA_ORIENTATION=+